MAIFIDPRGQLLVLLGYLLGYSPGFGWRLMSKRWFLQLKDFFQIKFLSPDVYYISDLPSDLHWNDVFVIGTVAFLFSLLATIFPALRAAKTQPAEALRYE